ncbi:serine/threonine protein kinase [Pseudobdellovibrio exovorus]|uniref:Stress response kinase A n=1 Tax=Pseudobdellovibrio exovorus JSS TaxID=1184267 RepID=M4VMV6_9BACT|nr:serine/threonine protein kinase [Pseudobdellovibrio exovorus]AGH94424.1 serine/threonine protein kinase [Pseudobdellovibrio exovorus JSS]
MQTDSQNFYQLDPNLILATAEQNNFFVTGELIQLNSYENRVFDIKLENEMSLNKNSASSNSISHNSVINNSIIAKYYRPNRWSRETILDEHRFIQELKSEGIEVASTYTLKNNSSVDMVDGIYYSFFEKVRGRMVQELTPSHFKKLGRWLARLHNVGSQKIAEHRSFIGPSNDGKWDQLDQLLSRVAPEVVGRYEAAAVRIFEELDERLAQLSDQDFIRLHGDLHRGNILEDSTGDFVVVDFDDMINGPAVQDFWMLMPSTEIDSPEFQGLIDSYSELREFPYEQLSLIPLLRGYRIITYAMWIMNRWSDPSFPRLFPEYGSYLYWAEETESLEKLK